MLKNAWVAQGHYSVLAVSNDYSIVTWPITCRLLGNHQNRAKKHRKKRQTTPRSAFQLPCCVSLFSCHCVCLVFSSACQFVKDLKVHHQWSFIDGCVYYLLWSLTITNNKWSLQLSNFVFKYLFVCCVHEMFEFLFFPSFCVKFFPITLQLIEYSKKFLAK